jgi:hypothetical protein
MKPSFLGAMNSICNHEYMISHLFSQESHPSADANEVRTRLLKTENIFLQRGLHFLGEEGMFSWSPLIPLLLVLNLGFSSL